MKFYQNKQEILILKYIILKLNQTENAYMFKIYFMTLNLSAILCLYKNNFVLLSLTKDILLNTSFKFYERGINNL